MTGGTIENILVDVDVSLGNEALGKTYAEMGMSWMWPIPKVQKLITQVEGQEYLQKALDEADENLEVFRQRFPKLTIVPLSADTEEGLEGLRKELDERVGYRRDKDL